MPGHYTDYELNDFVKDDAFIDWVKHPDAESNAFWQAFLDEVPQQRATLQQARVLVQQLTQAGRFETIHDDARIIWQDISQQLKKQPSLSGMSRLKLLPWRWVAAASVVLVVALSGWFLRVSSQQADTLADAKKSASLSNKFYVNINNTQPQPRAVHLPDGSTVTLNQGSQLRYPKTFAPGKRVVYLTGEAFFSVRKDPSKPFYVYANELATKVLGTSFWIRAFDNDPNVTVSVRTGRVSVFASKQRLNEDPEMAGLVLTPNQKAIFKRSDQRLTRTVVEAPVALLPQEQVQQFKFDDAPASKIFAALEKTYGIEIVYDKEVMAHCTLTASLTDERLFEKLDVICQSLEATYKVVDAQVIISSKGCD